MLAKILSAAPLAAATVSLHAGGLAFLPTALLKPHALPPARFWPVTWLLVCITWSLLLVHAAEITIWALFYFWEECLPYVTSAFYFSGVTYSTIGYGHLLLSISWRMLAPIEGLTGILMCGLSTGFFFVVVSRLFGSPFNATSFSES